MPERDETSTVVELRRRSPSPEIELDGAHHAVIESIRSLKRDTEREEREAVQSFEDAVAIHPMPHPEQTGPTSGVK